MLPIYGSYEEKVQGIVGKPSWVMYADKLEGDKKEFCRLSIGKAVKNALNELCAIESADSPIGTESNNPFTDLDEGRALIIKYNSKATKAADYYSTYIDSTLIKGSGGRVQLHPLSDDDLLKFEKYESLDSMYNNNYTSHDFELALAGLRIVDEENGYGVFDYDDFLDICEKLASKYPDKDSKEAPKAEKSEPIDEFEEMSREELKAHIRKNKLSILVKSNMSDDDIKELIRSYEEEENEEEEAEEEEEEKPVVKKVAKTITKEVEEVEADEDADLPWEKDENDKEAEDKPSTEISAKDKLAALRAKMKK